MSKAHGRPHAVEEGDTLVAYEGESYEVRWTVDEMDETTVYLRRVDDDRVSGEETSKIHHYDLYLRLSSERVVRERDGRSEALTTT